MTLTGTTFGLLDAALDDELVVNKYGVLALIDGNVHCQGRVIVGNGATTTTYNSTDEEIVFKDSIVSSNLYQFNTVGSGNVSVVKGFVAKGAGGATFAYDASDVTSDLTLSGSTFIRAGLVDFASTSDVQASSFNNCGQVVPSTGIFKNVTLSNYVGTTGSLLFPSTDANISGLSFIICDNGVEYDATSDATSPTFDDFTFDDEAGNYDVNNTSGAEVSISKNNGSNPNSYNPAGDIVNFIGASVTTSVTIRDETDALLENVRVILQASDGTGDLPYRESVTITSVTTTATVAHTAHGMSTGNRVNIKGAVEDEYNGSFIITVTGVNAYTYTILATTSPATGTIVATGILLQGLTSALGVITDSRVLTNNQPVVGHARMATTTPRYKDEPISTTVDNATGATVSRKMRRDD